MKTRRCLITASGLLITLTVGLISYASSALASDQPKQAPAAALLALTPVLSICHRVTSTSRRSIAMFLKRRRILISSLDLDHTLK